MAVSTDRSSNYACANVNLYCAQCESQIGIFENEWIRLTSSYARSKEKGTHFGTEIGHRTQVVPSGPAQRSAEGCVMAEVFCRRCSNMVGQYCKDAPDITKQPLVDQYFYKLSRTFLKDSRTFMRVEPVFGYGSDMVKQPTSRSSTLPRASIVPTSRWADTPVRQSSRTPIMPMQGPSRFSVRQESHKSPMLTSDPVDDKGEQSSAELQQLRDDIAQQRSVIRKQSKQWSIQTMRLDDLEARLGGYDNNVDDQESCLLAQADRIAEQDGVIAVQTKKLEDQQIQLLRITNQLNKLQNTMNIVKNFLGSKQSTSGAINSNSGLGSAFGSIGHIQGLSKEIQNLRKENHIMKSQMLSNPSDIRALSEEGVSEDTSQENSSITTANMDQVLGKRKRSELGRLSFLGLGESAVNQKNSGSRFDNGSGQMPTPQSSDGGQDSPEYIPPKANNRTNQRRRTTENRRSYKEATSPDAEDVAQSVDDSLAMLPDRSPSPHGENSVQSEPMSTVSKEVPGARSALTTNALTSRTRRSSMARATPRRRSTRLQSISIVDIEDSDFESHVVHTPRGELRRSTRVTTKASPPKNVDDNTKSEGQVAESQSSTSPLTPIRSIGGSESPTNHVTASQPRLPSVQVASGILGVNLEALIASSQALTRSLNLPQGIRNPQSQGSRSTNARDKTKAQSRPSNTSVDERVHLDSGASLTSDIVLDAVGYSEICFIENSEVEDNIDTSDDDEDLMQPDTGLYGEDSLIEGENSPSSDKENVTGFDHMHSATEISTECQSKSMAPEPSKYKRSSLTRKVITLDNAHVATPQMFAQAYVGQASRMIKTVKPPVHERDLNEELIEMELSKWIGKPKNCKEYRDAITTARARSKNHNKAAFLWSKGLNYSLSDPSSKLPDKIVVDSDHNANDTIVLDTADVEIPSEIATHENESYENSFVHSESISNEQPRATRARTKRISIPLVSGLEEVESQAVTMAGNKSVFLRRRSEGRAKRLRTSDASFAEADNTMHLDQTDNNEALPTSVPLSETVADDAEDNEESAEVMDTARYKPSGRPRGRPRKSVAPEALTAADPVQPVEIVDDTSNLEQMPNTLTQTLSISAKVVELNEQQPVSPTAQARKREEAILLRDRMAKELMERDDMDM